MSPRRLAAALIVGVLAGGCASPSPARFSPSAPTATLGPSPGATATRTDTPSPTATAAPTPVASPTPRALRPGEVDWGKVPFANGLRDRYGSTVINAMAEAKAGSSLLAGGLPAPPPGFPPT